MLSSPDVGCKVIVNDDDNTVEGVIGGVYECDANVLYNGIIMVMVGLSCAVLMCCVLPHRER